MDRKSPVDTHIGQRLKEYRQHRGMTVRELAEAAHVTPGQISRYEHGRDRISHERVIEFARILRIKSNDLYQPPGSRLRRNHAKSFSRKPHSPPREQRRAGRIKHLPKTYAASARRRAFQAYHRWCASGASEDRGRLARTVHRRLPSRPP